MTGVQVRRSNRFGRIIAPLLTAVLLIAFAANGRGDDFSVPDASPISAPGTATANTADTPNAPNTFTPLNTSSESRAHQPAAGGDEARTPIAPEQPEHKAAHKSGSAFVRMTANLLLVLAVGFLVFYFLKKSAPRNNARLPKEIFERLGEIPWTSKTRLTVVRFGSKLLLLSTGGERVETVAELTDPHEVAALLNRVKSDADVLKEGRKG